MKDKYSINVILLPLKDLSMEKLRQVLCLKSKSEIQERKIDI